MSNDTKTETPENIDHDEPNHSASSPILAPHMMSSATATTPSHVTFDEHATANTIVTAAVVPVASSWEEDSVAEMDYVRELASTSSTHLKTPPPTSTSAPHDDDSTKGSTKPPPSLSPLTEPRTRAQTPYPSTTTTTTPSASTTPLFDVKTNHEEGSLYVPPSDLAGLSARVPIPPGHHPMALPQFNTVQTCMWTASHAANCPTEDRSASLVNILLQPLPSSYYVNDNETQLIVSQNHAHQQDYTCLLRLNLWCVVDGHGGGCVASYVSEVLLPHIAASVSRALHCAILERGVCIVNGQRRDVNALDFDGLIQTTNNATNTTAIHRNPNSIHYRSERSDSEEEQAPPPASLPGQQRRRMPPRRRRRSSTVGDDEEDDEASTLHCPDGNTSSTTTSAATHKKRPSHVQHEDQASSCKTSVKTAASPETREEFVGMHSPKEVACITRAITESFLAVDEGWINSIDPVATHQTSCQSNGRWNSGACALVVFTIQRLEWTSVETPGREMEPRDPEKSRLNTCQNRDAARRRMLDSANRKSSSTTSSTGSTSSSLTTEVHHASGIESEITETEEEDEQGRVGLEKMRGDPVPLPSAREEGNRESFLSPPGACSCHSYRAHDAMIYTAHVGDCRAVMLGSAPPRTIKVGDFVKGDSSSTTTDDESSHHSSDETECLSSSDHEADTSEDEDVEGHHRKEGMIKKAEDPSNKFISLRPRRVARVRRKSCNDAEGPFIALPPWRGDEAKSPPDRRTSPRGEARPHAESNNDPSDSSTSSQDSIDLLPLLQLLPATGPIDLTTDHSAYNPAEVTAVLRRCNNAPRAISSGMGGGIKRVAGSLAVTRALGDAYLKTPLLSFNPYKRHAPYITARPEVNCRPLVKNGDKVLILATDGVWERATGEDVLRWVRNFYAERIAEAERRRVRRATTMDKNYPSNEVDTMVGEPSPTAPSTPSKSSSAANNQEGSERDLFEKNEPEKNETSGEKVDPDSTLDPEQREKNNEHSHYQAGLQTEPPSAKREMTSSPVNHPAAKRRKRNRPNRISYNVADVIVRRVLNKVRRARNISSLQALMSLPQGRARRSKHDDITASVVDLSAFVS